MKRAMASQVIPSPLVQLNTHQYQFIDDCSAGHALDKICPIWETATLAYNSRYEDDLSPEELSHAFMFYKYFDFKRSFRPAYKPAPAMALAWPSIPRRFSFLTPPPSLGRPRSDSVTSNVSSSLPSTMMKVLTTDQIGFVASSIQAAEDRGAPKWDRITELFNKRYEDDVTEAELSEAFLLS